MNKKTRNIIISILGMLLLTAVLGTFVALNLAPGDDTSPDVIDAADDISGLSLDEMWTLGCTENSGYEVEVLGAGMGSDEQVTNNPQTISISNIDTIEFMFAQVVVNGVAESTVPPGSVTISTPTEQQVLATPTRTDKGFIYEAKLDPGAQVIADIAGEGVFPRHTPRSLTVYVFRNTGTTNYSAGKLLMKYIATDGSMRHFETLPIPSADAPRDVFVDFMVSDIKNNSQGVTLRAVSGNVSVELPINTSNKGDELLVETIQLRNVSGQSKSVDAKVLINQLGPEAENVYFHGVQVRTSCPGSQGGGNSSGDGGSTGSGDGGTSQVFQTYDVGMCMFFVDSENNIGGDNIPEETEFSIDMYYEPTPAEGDFVSEYGSEVYPHSVSLPQDLNADKLYNDGINDAYCFDRYEFSIPEGEKRNVTYNQETISLSDQWEIPRFNDQHTEDVADLDHFYEYDDQHFDGTPDEEQDINLNADGHIALLDRNRTIFILNQYKSPFPEPSPTDAPTPTPSISPTATEDPGDDSGSGDTGSGSSGGSSGSSSGSSSSGSSSSGSGGSGVSNSTMTIAGTFWEDVNNDGQKDDSENRIEGVEVELISNSLVIATDSADSAGNYIFQGIDEGTYDVEIASSNFDSTGILADASYTSSLPTVNDDLDSDFNVQTNRASTLNTDTMHIDAGFIFSSNSGNDSGSSTGGSSSSGGGSGFATPVPVTPVPSMTTYPISSDSDSGIVTGTPTPIMTTTITPYTTNTDDVSGADISDLPETSFVYLFNPFVIIIAGIFISLGYASYEYGYAYALAKRLNISGILALFTSSERKYQKREFEKSIEEDR